MLVGLAWNGPGVVSLYAMIRLLRGLPSKLRGQTRIVVCATIGIGILAGLLGAIETTVLLLGFDRVVGMDSETNVIFAARLIGTSVLFVLGALLTGLAAEKLFPKICRRGATRDIALIVSFFLIFRPFAYYWLVWAWTRNNILLGLVWHGGGVLCLYWTINLIGRSYLKLRGQAKTMVRRTIGLGILAGILGVVAASMLVLALDRVVNLDPSADGIFAARLIGTSVLFVLGALLTGLAAEVFFPKLCLQVATCDIALSVALLVILEPVVYGWATGAGPPLYN